MAVFARNLARVPAFRERCPAEMSLQTERSTSLPITALMMRRAWTTFTQSGATTIANECEVDVGASSVGYMVESGPKLLIVIRRDRAISRHSHLLVVGLGRCKGLELLPKAPTHIHEQAL
jgi:hypothetical protein